MVTTEKHHVMRKKDDARVSETPLNDRFTKNVFLNLFSNHERNTSRDEIKKRCLREQNTFESIDL